MLRNVKCKSEIFFWYCTPDSESFTSLTQIFRIDSITLELIRMSYMLATSSKQHMIIIPAYVYIYYTCIIPINSQIVCGEV